jgi:2,5-diketo-D-gluconate reductase A
MPLIGLGVWQIPARRETEQAVTWALEAGYRHVDTAAAYRNEEGVGRAVPGERPPARALPVGSHRRAGRRP